MITLDSLETALQLECPQHEDMWGKEMFLLRCLHPTLLDWECCHLGEEIITISPNIGNVIELALEEPILGFIITYKWQLIRGLAMSTGKKIF